eukprot:7420314-Pyramimonas_sp.AAC.1
MRQRGGTGESSGNPSGARDGNEEEAKTNGQQRGESSGDPPSTPGGHEAAAKRQRSGSGAEKNCTVATPR